MLSVRIVLIIPRSQECGKLRAAIIAHIRDASILKRVWVCARA